MRAFIFPTWEKKELNVNKMGEKQKKKAEHKHIK